MEHSEIKNNKQSAREFLGLVITGKIDEAYQKYVNVNGKHHNAFFPAGFPALQEAMKANHAQFPNKQFTVKNVISDGDLVVVHSHLTLSPGKSGMVTVHILRFQDSKIVEMWDCGQPIPTDCPNKDGVF